MPDSEKRGRTGPTRGRTGDGAARRRRPPGPRPPAPRTGRRNRGLPGAWPGLAALVLLGAGTVGTIVLNTDPSCADRARAIPQGWADDVVHSAQTSGLPPEVVAAQLDVESRWDPEAVSPVGAEGLAQFMPETWELYGRGEATDPEASIRAQGHYLRDLRGMVSELEPADPDEEIELVLAAYNAGPTVVLEQGGVPPYPETERYVEQITELAGTRYRDVCPDGA